MCFSHTHKLTKIVLQVLQFLGYQIVSFDPVNRTMIVVSLILRNVPARFYRSITAFAEVEEPEEMGKSLGTGVNRHRSIARCRGCFDEYRPTGSSL